MTLGYIYFNRPGASIEEHEDNLIACLSEATSTWSADAEVNGGGSNGLLGNLISGGIASAANRGTTASALENCMVVLGWRVVLLPETEGKAIAMLPPPEAAAKLTPWIGATEPHGQIFRVWGNDAANDAMKRWSLRPPHINDGLLSLKLIEAGNLKTARKQADKGAADNAGDATPRPKPVPRDKRWPKGRLTQAELINLPPQAAVLLMGMAGGRTALELERVGSLADQRPGLTDGKPDLLRAFGSSGAFVIPPGRWRIRALTDGLLSINMCLGSPAFEVKAGDVLFGGSFDLKGAKLGPEMNLEYARTWLAGTDLAVQVKAVQWVNGSRGQCGNNTIYAIEFPEFQFEQNYRWGSKTD